MKDFDPNVHVGVFKAAIRTTSETKNVKIVNIISFTIRDIVFDWCKNYMWNYLNYTFAELQLVFYKRYRKF